MLWAKKQDCMGTFNHASLPARANVKRTLTALPLILVDTLLRWQERAVERRALREMDNRMLKDIGISALDADREGRKPFWRS